MRVAEQDRPDVAKARQEWRASQPDLNPEHLVFIDETGAKTNMVRLYGRAPRGCRLVASAPHGHWMTTTFVGALRYDAITAPCVFDGPMNGACFLAYVEHFLLPTCARPMSSSWTICHRTKSLASGRQSSEPGATLRYLPPYSPDFNPIEQVFAKFKLRKAAARTFEDLIKAISQALAGFKQQECKNYIANSGYRHAS